MPLKFGRDKGIIGLDIGTQTIKFAEARPTKGAPEIVNLGLEPTPPEAFAQGEVISEPEALGVAIRDLLARKGVEGKRKVVLSANGQTSVVVRIIEVPKVTGSELAETVKWELDRFVPFDTTGASIDFKPLQDPSKLPPTTPNMQVLLAAAQEELIESYLKVVRVANLDPVAIDIQPLADARALISLGAEDFSKAIAIINFGTNLTTISIHREGVMAFLRAITIAGNTFTNAISKGLQIDPKEAERLKKEYGCALLEVPGEPAPPPQVELPPTVAAEKPETAQAPEEYLYEPLEPEKIEEPGKEAQPPVVSDELKMNLYGVISPVLEDLTTELRRSFDYYTARAKVTIDKVFLVGGGAKLRYLDRYLSGELGVDVVIGNSLKNAEIAPSVEFASELLPLMTVSVGLAIRDLI